MTEQPPEDFLTLEKALLDYIKCSICGGDIDRDHFRNVLINSYAYKGIMCPECEAKNGHS